jgi:quercetin dioxygenase-like cupin family protein
MDVQAFETDLKNTGYGDIVHKEGVPGSTNQPHQHDFAVRGLVVSGEFILTKEGTPTTYRSGDTFEMDANCSHTEGFGANGSTYIIGRKHAMVTSS